MNGFRREGEVEVDTKCGPLSGVRVVDVGVWHAGPGASAILGDLGAQVIKIETLQGDPERYNSNFNAITASHAAITALFAREMHGFGQEVNTFLYGAATWLQHANLMYTSIRNQEIDLSWDRTGASVLLTTLRIDSWVTQACRGAPSNSAGRTLVFIVRHSGWGNTRGRC